MEQKNKYEGQDLAFGLICITQNTACTSGFITQKIGKYLVFILKQSEANIPITFIGAIIFLFLFLYAITVSTFNSLIPLQA